MHLRSIIWVVVLRTYHTWATFFAYFAVEHVAPFKVRAFLVGFQRGHCHVLRTGPYQVIVPTRASTHKQRTARDAVKANEKACYICDMH